MLSDPKILFAVCTIAAAIPVAIWLYLLFHKKEKSKKTTAIIFLLGCTTPLIVLGIQYFWDIFPRFNINNFIENNVVETNSMFLLIFILFGAMEEIVKHQVITITDKKTLLIKNIDDAIRYSLAAALGFAFVENIYYLYEFWPLISTGELAGMYIFRSIFTAAAHMIFSGIFGFYYGLGKYAPALLDHDKARKKSLILTKILQKIFNLAPSHAYQQSMIFKGLTLAIILHSIHNFLLQFNITFPVIIFDAIGFSILLYLLKLKASQLSLVVDLSEKKKSTIDASSEETIIELMGIWIEEKKYQEVIETADRLLKKSPDNKTAQILKAKAQDFIEDKKALKEILNPEK